MPIIITNALKNHQNNYHLFDKINPLTSKLKLNQIFIKNPYTLSLKNTSTWKSNSLPQKNPDKI